MPERWLHIFESRGMSSQGRPLSWAFVSSQHVDTKKVTTVGGLPAEHKEPFQAPTTYFFDEPVQQLENSKEVQVGLHLIRNVCRFDGNPLVTVIDFGRTYFCHPLLFSKHFLEVEMCRHSVLHPLKTQKRTCCNAIKNH